MMILEVGGIDKWLESTKSCLPLHPNYEFTAAQNGIDGTEKS
jgi:hypothetical protein